jgi:NAD(P)-dependent dehydrogenase (short-subunit alcohol dehydrogenase family)
METTTAAAKQQSKRLAGKVAIITGGTSGIGEATVDLFVAEGAKVVLVGRNAAAGAAIVDRLGANAHFVAADVTKEAEIENAVAETVRHFGGLDILFNNAGGASRGDVDTITQEDFDNAIGLLLGSVMFGMRHASPIMKAQGYGRIINNSSVAALRTHMGGYLYSTAKAAVTHATKMAGMSLARHGVTVNSISPGGIATPIFFGGSTAASQLDPAQMQTNMGMVEAGIAKATPSQKTGYPSDIAYAALYLASDEARFVNCHDLVVDAGMTAGGRNNFE